MLRGCQHTATVMMAFPALRGALEVVATMEAVAAKWLRAEEEIQQMGRLNNSALEGAGEEPLRRGAGVARSGAVQRGRGQRAPRRAAAGARCPAGELAGAGTGSTGDDESCCCGENDVAAGAGAAGAGEHGEEAGTSSLPAYRRTCAVRGVWRGHGQGAALLLLPLPCRHLCACAARAWVLGRFSDEIVWGMCARPIRQAPTSLGVKLTECQ